MATDVAARGIDLPSLSLVIHVEVPRDAEALQHRSGRTGRAGKKGTAVLIVPYPRRRRVEGMLRSARIDAEWGNAPTAREIRQQDRERLLETLMAPIEVEDEDRELAARLLEEKSPADIAAALVHAHRAKMPQPEDLIENTPDARRAAQEERHRPGFEDTIWFKMDIGRRQNADARWLLPLICRRGHITRNEVGAIRIGQAETFFQVPRNIADRFADALDRTAASESDEENTVRIVHSPEGPREQARENRKGNFKGKPKGKFGNSGGGSGAGARVHAKPADGKPAGAKKHRKGGFKGPKSDGGPGGRKKGKFVNRNKGPAS